MGYFVGVIDITRAPGDNPRAWTLGAAITYVSDACDHIMVRPGATTDGASVPRLFWRIAPPFADRHLAAALVHDQLYATRGAMGKYTRSECDAIFREAMLAGGVGKFRAWVLWMAVRVGGSAAFESRSEAQARENMRHLEIWRA